MPSPRTRGAATAPVLVLFGVASVALVGRLLVSSDMSAFVPPVSEPREPRASALRGQIKEEVSIGPLATAPTPVFTALALAGCLAASLRLVRRHASAPNSTRAHMVQLKAEASDKESKEDEAEAAEAEEDDDDDLDELVMDDDDDEDFEDEDFEDEDDDDFEAGDGDVMYTEDSLDDGFFSRDEEGNPLEAVCKARFLKGSPWKFRRVLWQIRGRSYREALMLLEFMPWRACRPTLCALQSAAANAQNHFNMDKSRLFVYSCKADRGPYSKRMRPMSKGQPHMYRRRSTHLEIRVRELTDAELIKRKEFA